MIYQNVTLLNLSSSNISYIIDEYLILSALVKTSEIKDPLNVNKQNSFKPH